MRSKAAAAFSSRWLPITLVVSWWAWCSAIYAAGWPIQYSHVNLLWVTALMSATAILAVLGFRISVSSASLTPLPQRNAVPMVVLIGFAASLLLVIPLTQTYSGLRPQDIFNALTDQTAAYNSASQRIAQGLSSRVGIVAVETLAAPFTLTVVPYFALAWFEARKHGIPFLIAILVPAYLGLLEGRSAEIGLVALLTVVAWILSRVRRRLPLRRQELFAIAGLVLIGLTLFGLQKMSRFGAGPVCLPGPPDPCAFDHPNGIAGSGLIFASYASQGLEGLGKALEARWVFGWGFSHSPAISSLMVNLLHVRQPDVVTTQLTSYGWSASANWSTALASIADDVPWPLVPAVIGVQALVLGLAWRSAVERAGWLAVTVCCYTFVGLVFVPQNLQLAISGPTYVGYLVLVIAFLVRTLWSRFAPRTDVDRAHVLTSPNATT
jgi:hypothetical protein